MIVDVGGGTTEVAVMSLADIAVVHSIRVAGDEMDEDIIQYARQKYNLLIGERTAEIIKNTIGNAYPDPKKPKYLDIKGRDLVSGIPRILRVDNNEIRLAISEQIDAISDRSKSLSSSRLTIQMSSSSSFMRAPR